MFEHLVSSKTCQCGGRPPIRWRYAWFWENPKADGPRGPPSYQVHIPNLFCSSQWATALRFVKVVLVFLDRLPLEVNVCVSFTKGGLLVGTRAFLLATNHTNLSGVHCFPTILQILLMQLSEWIFKNLAIDQIDHLDNLSMLLVSPDLWKILVLQDQSMSFSFPQSMIHGVHMSRQPRCEPSGEV